jgi:hypothetical protein
MEEVEAATIRQSLDDPIEHDRHEKKIRKHMEMARFCHEKLQRDDIFGRVFATSGYRVDMTPVPGFRHGCTLDWGLISVNESRLGTNQVCHSDTSPTRDLTDRMMGAVAIHV